MALFLSPIPDSVLTELEKRTKAMGDSSGGSRPNMSALSGGDKWKFGRTPFVRAASFACLRDSFDPMFMKFWADSGEPMQKAMDEWTGDGAPMNAHPLKHHHRLKNVLYGGGLKNKSNQSIDPNVYTNILDDHSNYDNGYDGHFASKLEGYKSSTNTQQDSNSRIGVPTPGITDITCENVGQLGSLKKIDITVECHDFAQLQMIESLYMSPGVTVLVEWGWSVNSDGTDTTNFLADISSENLVNITALHQKIQNKSANSKYAYEGAIATITNYTWSAKTNGSFTCQISLRSRGEAMLGTQMKSAHSPLIDSIEKMTTSYKNLEFSVPTDTKTGKRSKPYDSNGNVAQTHLESNLNTIPNNYYPSFHAAGGMLSISGIQSTEVVDLNSITATSAMPAFPRFYYRFKALQASKKRNEIADAAKNSINSGKKNSESQNAMAKQIAQDTIANYVAQIVAPAISKHSAGTGRQGRSEPEFNQSNGATYTLNDYGLSSMDFSIGSINFDGMFGQPWNPGYKHTPGYTRHFPFSTFVSMPWRKRQAMSWAYNDLQSQVAEDSSARWTGIGSPNGTGTTIKMMYRPTYENNKYGLLFGGYYPMGNGGDWADYWSNSIMDPIRPGENEDNPGMNLNQAFYKYYQALHTPKWRSSSRDSDVTAGKISHSGWSNVKTMADIAHPLLHVVAKAYIGFSGGKGKNITHQSMQGYGVWPATKTVIGAAAPLGALGLSMKTACSAAGNADTLGFQQGFDKDVQQYIKKHFGKIPSSTHVFQYIRGTNPVTKSNYFTKKTDISAAQSAWTDLDMMVGKSGLDTDGSYGLPNKFSRGDVGRYFGAIHVRYPKLNIHSRLSTGINKTALTTKLFYGSGVDSFGLYNNGATRNKKGYGNITQSGVSKNAEGSPDPIEIRKLPSGPGFAVMDYPMPLWGHYSRLDSKGNFRFVKEIRDNKKKFMNEVREKKKNAALAKKLAFADAYKQYEEFRKVTDGDAFIPFSVLERIINDNTSLETVEGQKVTRFDSGDHLLAGAAYSRPENTKDAGKFITTPAFVEMVNAYNDGGYDYAASGAGFIGQSASELATGIVPIDINTRLAVYRGEAEAGAEDGEDVPLPAIEPGLPSYGFKDSSMNFATYFYAAAVDLETGLPDGLYQTVSLPSKICNHKYLASTDPRVCILPGQTGITTMKGELNAPDVISDDVNNQKIKDLHNFKRFSDDPDRGYGLVSNILINTEFINKCFQSATTIKDGMQKVLDGVSGACGNIWNFKFQIDGDIDSGATRIIDANYSNSHCDIVAEFPVQRTDSIVRNYSLESKIPNAMAVQALYGNNTAFSDGTVPNSLYELGNMFVDLAHENIQIPISNAETEDGDDAFQIPKTKTKRVQALGYILSYHVHENLSETHVAFSERLLQTILNDRSGAGAGDNALLDHNIIPLKMSFEIDGIGGIHFGHAVTSTHLPQRYKDTVCFQVTNVKHSIKTNGWTTTVEAIMRRRPVEMGVYRIGSSTQEGMEFDRQFVRKLTKDQLKFTRSPISWYREEDIGILETLGAISETPVDEIMKQDGYVSGTDSANEANKNTEGS